MQTSEIFIALPDQLFLLCRQGIKRRVYRKIKLCGVINQLILPCFHLLALPASYSPLINSLRFIRYNQVRIDTHYRSHTLTFRTSTYRAVEIKQVFAWLDKLYAIRFKTLGENLLFIVLPYATFAVSFKESRLDAICKTVTCRRLMVHYNTIHQQKRFVTLYFLPRTVIQAHRIAINQQSTETLTLPKTELLL